MNTELRRKQTLMRRTRRSSLQIQLLILLNKPKHLQNKSSSRMVKFSGSFSSMYKMVYSILKRITLHVGSLSRGKCENMENPSNINSCSSCLIIVGILVCNINVETGLLQCWCQTRAIQFDVLMAVDIKINVFSDVTSTRNLVERCKCFGGICCVHLQHQLWRWSQWAPPGTSVNT